MAWKLVRQDTHGTRFDVAKYETKADAEVAMAEFEAGYPHHQTYYVEQSQFESLRAAAPALTEALFAKTPPHGTTRTIWSDQPGSTNMSWTIDDAPSRAEFTERFAEITKQFVDFIRGFGAAAPDSRFLASDQDGQEIAWIWDMNSFSFAGAVGNAEDAAGFATNMINQGMHFSCMVAIEEADRTASHEIWLTTYEGNERPVWPEGKHPLMQINHLGIGNGPTSS